MLALPLRLSSRLTVAAERPSIAPIRRSDHLLIAEGEASTWNSSWPLITEIRNGRCGILLQPETLDGEMLLRTPFPRIQRSEFPPGRGMFAARNQVARVQLPYVDALRATVKAVLATNDPAFGNTGPRLAELLDSLERATHWLAAQKGSDAALAGATPYLRMFGSAAGGCMLADQALAALHESGDAPARIALARFFAENIAVPAIGLERTVTEGADSVNDAQAALEA